MSIESIKGKQSLPPQSRAQNTRSVSPNTENTRGVSSQDSDIKLTKESLRLREIEAEIGKQPVVDKERVKALRETILSGEYKIDSTKIAEKLIALEDELFK